MSIDPHYGIMYMVMQLKTGLISQPSVLLETGTEQNLFALLPNENDYAALKNRFSIHVSRIITSYLEFYKEDFEGSIEHHVKHRYSKDMSV